MLSLYKPQAKNKNNRVAEIVELKLVWSMDS